MTSDDQSARRPVPMDRTLIDAHHNFDEPATSVDTVKLAPGVRIEQYELIRELGRGGMGQVFLARDNKLGRRVAIKFLISGQKRFGERFRIEARATAQCSHEHIVTLYEIDEYVGLPYMVLEYVEGTTLARMMENRRLPVARTVELIMPVVRALAHAHAANIVHRDLKPENIIVTAAGTVKVLDFGVAKLFASSQPTERRRHPPTPGDIEATRAGSMVGTLPYMSPEQLGTDEVDHRSDLWAIGIILYEMLAGEHPLAPVTQGRLFGAAAALDEPMRRLDVPGLPDRIVHIVARCLAKRKADRYASAAELCADLEPLLPGRTGRSLGGDESPYPGLTAFQEADANRFFGRKQDIAALVAKLREQPLVGVIGPSGVGKSSFVRAGVVPALKTSGEPWEILVVRPGRYPLAALASTLEQMRETRDSDPLIADDITFLLRREPGTFGARLRARARRKRSQIVVFVDQHEELYTLVADAEERLAFTACLAGAADDPSGPVRVIVAMRSDFLDRAAEDRRFVEELSLLFLQPPSRAGLEEALVQPLEMVGYSFEAGVVEAMLAALATTPGALPLLQFTAAKLWDARDRQRRVLARDSYDAMGGVAGALASHADEVLAGLAAPDRQLARAIFQRLVTPERTRAIVDTNELRDVAPDVDRVIGALVAARLLLVQSREEGAAVEIVHESLIKSWPQLQRWLDENHEDAAYLAQIRAAAKQWDAKGRPQGLLWRNEAMEEARLWRARYRGELPAREQDFIAAVIALGTRAARVKRRLVIAGFVVLGALVAAASTGMLLIRDAEQAARQAEREAVERARMESEAKAEAERQAVLAKQAERRAVENAERAEREKERAMVADQARAQETSARHTADAKAADATSKAALARAEAAKKAAEAHALEEKEAKRKKAAGQITTELK